jgi:hypothetical protein
VVGVTVATSAHSASGMGCWASATVFTRSSCAVVHS